jgi:hypothetical protein
MVPEWTWVGEFGEFVVWEGIDGTIHTEFESKAETALIKALFGGWDANTEG